MNTDNYNLGRRLLVWFFQALFGNGLLFLVVLVQHLRAGDPDSWPIALFYLLTGLGVFLIVSLPFVVVWVKTTQRNSCRFAQGEELRHQMRSHFHLMLAGGLWGGLFLYDRLGNANHILLIASLQLVYGLGLELSLFLDGKNN